MPIILEYAKMRIQDIKTEAQQFFKAPLDYVLSRQILRKALLLEYLDNVRPVLGTKYEHFIEKGVKG